MFIFSKIITGISVGMNSTLVPLYIKEMTPHAISKKSAVNNLIPDYTFE